MSGEAVIHHLFPNGVHAEVIIDDGNGDVTVRSVEFEFVDDDRDLLEPRESLPEAFEDQIRGSLREAGYSVKALRKP